MFKFGFKFVELFELNCMMQWGVKYYRRIMQRGVKSSRRVMQQGVNLAVESQV
jgi:hypothetical protein